VNLRFANNSLIPAANAAGIFALFSKKAGFTKKTDSANNNLIIY